MKKTAVLLLGLILASCATPKSAGDYQGLGSSSVSPEVLKSFAPPVLEPKLADQVSHMLEIDSPGVGRMNPIEHALYFTWRVTGVSQVWRVDGPMRFPKQVTSGTDKTQLEDITQDGKYLVLSRDHAGEENPGLYLQPTAGGPLIEIQHKKGVQTHFAYSSTDAATIFYFANDIKPESYALYAYWPSSGKRELLFSEPGTWDLADVFADSKFLMAKHVSNFITEYSVFNLETRKVTPILGQGENEDYSASFGLNSNELFVATPKFGEFRRLYRYSKGEFTPLTPDVKRDVENFIISQNHILMFIQYNDGGFAKLEAINPQTMKPVKIPAVKGAESTSIVSVSRMARYSTLAVGTSTAPPVGYVYDFKDRTLTQWVAPSAPEVDMSKFVASTLESYTAKDGTKIPMLVWRPKECASSPCPVIVNFHGGPESQSRPGFNRAAELFVTNGFVFVEPNVRGSDGYGKTYLHADDGPKRLDVLSDIPDCADFIRREWKAPKVGVMGGSYGGYATLIAMTKYAGAYDAGVEIVGMSNLKTFLMNTAPYRRTLRIAEYGDPERDAEALKQLSPITYVKQVKAPLMMIQGASDPRVPVGEAVQMQSALKERGVQAPLIIFADEGHGAAKRENSVIQLGAALEFFKTNLR